LVKTSTNYVANNVSEKRRVCGDCQEENNNDDKDKQKYERDWHMNKLSLMSRCT